MAWVKELLDLVFNDGAQVGHKEGRFASHHESFAFDRDTIKVSQDCMLCISG
jgi:hypothetical protein